MMDWLYQIAESWLPLYAVHMLEISLFMALVWAADRWLRLPLAARYVLWLLALLKVFVPPLLQSPGAVNDFVAGQTILPAFTLEAPVAAAPPGLSAATLLFLTWVASGLIFFAVMLLRHLALRRRLAPAKPIVVPADILPRAGASVSFFLCAGMASPLLTGLRRPRLYLPEDFTHWSPQARHSILHHELAHVRHRDLLLLAAQHLAIIFCGLNPLTWVLHRRLLEIQELRCDAAVLRDAGISAVAYSKILYSFLERQYTRQTTLLAGNYFAESRRSLLRRFQIVLNSGGGLMQNKRRWHYALLALAGLAFIPFSWQCSKDQFSQKREILAPEEKKAAPADIFVAFDEPPTPIGGFEAIQENLHYPAIARKAGIEGRVIVNVLIDENGDVVDTKILKAVGEQAGLPEAAVAAIKSVKWTPAKQKGVPVRVWIGIPVVFQITSPQPAAPKEPAGAAQKPAVRPEPLPQAPFEQRGAGQPESRVQAMVSGETVYMRFEQRGAGRPESRPLSPAPEKAGTKNIFVRFDEPPKPVGGFRAIQENLRYPAIARQAGIEGRVIVNVLVNENGEVEQTSILRAVGEQAGMPEAAVAAIRSVKWTPARAKGAPVKVWVGIPVIFKLK